MTVAIIGYGTAGVNAAMALRTAGYSGEIHVFSDTAIPPYSPILTSYYAGGEKGYDECFPWPADELAALDLNVHAACPVTELDVATHTIRTPQGDFPYGKCVIASGASPSTAGFPAVEGGDYEPLVLRTMDDATRLRDALMRPGCERVLVSGASMVALKTLEAALNQGKRATIVGMNPHVLDFNALPETAVRFEKGLREKGVELRFGQTISAVKVTPVPGGNGDDGGCGDSGNCQSGGDDGNGDDGGSGGNSGNCWSGGGDGSNDGRSGDGDGGSGDGGSACQLEVTFSNGDVDTFDEIAVAHGVKSNLGFIPSGALEIDRALVVDEFMRTSDPDVYAAGDVAQALELVSGKKRVVGIWKNAAVQGAVAGAAIAAELAGGTPDPDQAFEGAIATNTIAVNGTLFISAGTMDTSGGRHVEIREAEDMTVAYVFDGEGSARRLVGFNLTCDHDEEGSVAYDTGAMLTLRIERACR